MEITREVGIQDESDDLNVGTSPLPPPPAGPVQVSTSVPGPSTASQKRSLKPPAPPLGALPGEPLEDELPGEEVESRDATDEEVHDYETKQLRGITLKLWEEGLKANPDEEAQVLALKRLTHAPSASIREMLPEFKARAEMYNWDVDKYLVENRRQVEDLVNRPELFNTYVKDTEQSWLWKKIRAAGKILEYQFESSQVKNPLTQEADGERPTLGFEPLHPDAKAPTKEELEPGKTQRVVRAPTDQEKSNPYSTNWERLRKESHLNSLYTKMALQRKSGQKTFDTQLQILDLEDELSVGIDLEGSALSTTIFDTQQVLSSQVDTYKGVAGAGVLAATAGLATKAVTKSTPVAKKVAKQVFKMAAPVGAFTSTWDNSFGSYQRELLKDPEISKNQALVDGAAVIGSTLESIIEVATDLGPVASGIFGPWKDAIAKGAGKEYLKKMLADQTFRKVLIQAGKRWAGGVAGEAGEEGVQTWVNALTIADTKWLAGGEFDIPIEETLKNTVNAMGSAAVGMAPIGLPAFGGTMLRRHIFLSQSQKSALRVEPIIQYAQSDSPMLKAAPDFVARHIELETQDTGEKVTHLYVDAKAFVDNFAKEGASPDAAITELMGPEGPNILKQAIATGGKLEIGMEDYLTKWGPKPIAAALALDTTTNSEYMTPRVLMQNQEQVNQQAEKIAEEVKKTKVDPFESLLSTLHDGLKKTGKYATDKDVAAQVQLWRSVLKTAAKLRKANPYNVALQYLPRISSTVGVTVGEFWKTHKDALTAEMSAKAQAQSGFKGAAFREKATGKVVNTGPMHDVVELSKQAGMTDEQAEAFLDSYETPNQTWEAGFIADDGTFFTREEAAQKLGAKYVRSDDVLRQSDQIASDQLSTVFADMDAAPRQKTFYRDPNAGVFNARAFARFKPSPEKPNIAHISVEGTAYVNENFGHGEGNTLYKITAAVLQRINPEAFKIGSDFAIYVKDQEELDGILSQMEAAPELKGLQVTGAIGKTYEEAGEINGKLKEARENDNKRAKRGQLPLGVTREQLAALLAKKIEPADLNIPEYMKETLDEMFFEEAFREVYIDGKTGLLSAEGWAAIPRKKFVASIDVAGLKTVNIDFNNKYGDLFLNRFGSLIRAMGGSQFDVAHLHGDEYAAQFDTQEELNQFLTRVQTASQYLTLAMKNGDNFYVREGIRFDFGIGEATDKLSAYEVGDAKLNDAKNRRGSKEERASAESVRNRKLSAEEFQADRDAIRERNSLARRTGNFGSGGRAQDYSGAREIAIGSVRTILTQTEASVFEQKVWHGSPNPNIRQMKLSRIGEGEGQQAYGWGLYFAQNERVAGSYVTEDPYSIYFLDGQRVTGSLEQAIEHIHGVMKAGKTFAEGQTEFIEYKSKAITEEKEYFAKTGRPYTFDTVKAMKAWIKKSESDIQWVKTLPADSVVTSQGKVESGSKYRVEIPESEVLLDLDASWKEQPDFVRNALEELGFYVRDGIVGLKLKDAFDNLEDENLGPVDNMTGRRIYQVLSEAYGGDENASMMLNGEGIPGNQYWDGVSRNKKEGTKNHVIWDETQIKVLEEHHDGEVKILEQKKFDSKTLAQKAYEAGLKKFGPSLEDRLKQNPEETFRGSGLVFSENHREDVPVEYTTLTKVIAEERYNSGEDDIGFGLDSYEYAFNPNTGEVVGTEGTPVEDMTVDGYIYTYYPDSGVRVIKVDSKIEQQNQDNFDSPEIPRGYVIKLTDGIRRLNHVVLTEHADLSTFLHESGHIFLDILNDTATLGAQPLSAINDFNTILKWMGVAKYDEIKSAHEEKFARAFEQYLLQGQAPSVELVGAFTRFKFWLRNIYGMIVPGTSGGKIDPVIKGVFDRMLATERQIEVAQARQGLRPMFRSPAEAGMSETEWLDYLDKQKEAVSLAAIRAEKHAMKDALQVSQEWWKKEMDVIRAKALAELHKRPDFRAWQYIRSGVFVNAEGVTEKVSFPKLDKNAVKTILGEEGAKPFEIHTKDKGLDPDILAPVFGYGTGAEMLRAIASMPDLEKVAASAAEMAMKENHPDVLSDMQEFERMVDEQMHNELTAQSLLSELKALRSKMRTNPKTGRPTLAAHSLGGVPIEAIKLAAKKIVQGMTIGRMKPGSVLTAEQNAAEAAFTAAAKDEYDSAYVSKQQQILNFYIYKELTKAVKARTSFKKLLKDMVSGERRGKLSLGGKELLDVVDAMTEAISARPVETDKKILGERVGLDMFLQRLDMELTQPAFDETVIRQLLAGKTEWKKLNVLQMEQVSNLFKQAKKIASHENQVLHEGKVVQIRDLADRISAEASENLPDQGPIPQSNTAVSRLYWMKQNVSGINASMIDPEILFRRLGKTAYNFFWKRYIDSRNNEDKLAKAVLTFFDKNWNDLPKEMQERRYELLPEGGLKLPDELNLGGPRDRQWLWMLFLNSGNQSNMDRLTGGYKWTEEEITKYLDGKLSAKEIEFLQSIWDLFDKELFPQISEIYAQENGIPPPKIPAKSFAIKDSEGNPVVVRGGYFPAKYKPGVSVIGQKQEAAAVENMDQVFPGASVMKGFTYGRAKRYTDVIDLNWHVIPSHVADVIHYLSFNNMVRDANKVLHTKDIATEDTGTGIKTVQNGMRTTIQRRLGEEYRHQIEAWLKVVATSRADSVPRQLSKVLAALGGVRSRFVMSALGYSLGVAAGDLPTVFTALTTGRVKMRYFAPAFVQTLVRGPSNYKENKALSKELQHRSERMRSRMMKEFGHVGEGGRISKPGAVLEAIRDGAWYFMEHTDRIVANGIFEGAKRQALASGLSQQEASDRADEDVRGLLPSHDLAEQPAFLRDKRSIGALIAFYGYFLKQYNVMREVWHPVWQEWHDAEGVTEKGKVVAIPATKAFGYTLATLFVTNVLGELMSGRGPEDDEEYGEWVLRKMLAAPWMMVPFIGSAGEAFTYKLVSGKYRKISIRAAPATAAVQRIYEDLERAARSKKTSESVWATLDALLTAANLPASQVAKTGKYITSLIDGSEKPKDPIEAGGGIIYGNRTNQPVNPLTMHRKD